MAKTKASTQEHLDIENIIDDLVILKTGWVALVLSLTAVNFDLLSEAEQDATIYAYGALLNSLTFPVEVLIRSKKADITSYFASLSEAEHAQPNPDLKRQIQKYLDFMDTGNLNPLFEKLAQDVLRLTPRYATFSSWDFTPENVYLTKSGTRYVDPHTEVIGMPIIDLACFAGTARDAHNLPDSAWGYTLLKSFALIEVANLMQITAAEAEKIFRIGRILQCIMSSIVRVNTDEQHATQLFHQASYHLARCME